MGAIISKLLNLDNVNKDDTIIAVVGPAGSGKRTFINKAAGKEILKVYHGLHAKQFEVQHVACSNPEYGPGRVVFVGIPAFDSELDEKIVEIKLEQWLKKLSSKDLTISGILYLHKITDFRLSNPPVHRLQRLRRLCNESSRGFPKRVALVTTMWVELKSQEVGSRREEELREDWLIPGSDVTQMMRFDNSFRGAWDIVSALTGTASASEGTADASKDDSRVTTLDPPRSSPKPGIVQNQARNKSKGKSLGAQGQNQPPPSPFASVPDHSPPESHPQPRITLENHQLEGNKRADPPRSLDAFRTEDTLHQDPLEDRENATLTSNTTDDSNTSTAETPPRHIRNPPKATSDLDAPLRQALEREVATALSVGHASHESLDGDQDYPDPSVMLQSGKVSKARLLKVVEMFFKDQECYKIFLGATDELAQQLLDIIQKLIDCAENPATWRSLLTALMRLSAQSGLYPRCLVLREVQRESQPVTAGQFGEIWKGTFGGERVSLKVVKLYQGGPTEHLLKNCVREAIIWSGLHHPNLLPFYGIFHLDDPYGRVCLVSPWMDNGNVCDYLKAHPTCPRMLLVHDVIKGLRYLHCEQIVHGDLKGVNILVTSSGHACLADFGLSSVMDEEILRWQSLETMTQTGGTIRWMAPELVDDSEDVVLSPRANFASDIFSMSSVIYEILSNKAPFHEFPRAETVISKVLKGVRPSRPSLTAAPELSDRVWEIMQLCWLKKPEERPSILGVADKLLPIKELMEEELGKGQPEDLRRVLTFRKTMHGVDGDTVPASDMEIFVQLMESTKARSQEICASVIASVDHLELQDSVAAGCSF